MLGESFIHLLKYKQDDTRLPDNTQKASFTPPNDSNHGSYTFFQEKDIPAPVEPALSDVKHVVKRSGSKAPQPSPGLYFFESHVGLSKSLGSFNTFNERHQIYSDLQLRSIYENQEFHLYSTKPQDWYTSDMEESSPQQLQFIPQQSHIPDDGYLVMDSSIMLNGEPPTNSMINGYLDRKLQEVYSQYLEERLACPGSSPGCSLLPLVPQPSLLQLSQKAYLDPEARSHPVIRNLTTSQGHLSQRTSTNFSSPVLRISNAEQGKKPWCPDYL